LKTLFLALCAWVRKIWLKGALKFLFRFLEIIQTQRFVSLLQVQDEVLFSVR